MQPYLILGLGAVYKDIVLTVAELKEDGKARAQSRTVRIGGNVTNSWNVLKAAVARSPHCRLGMLFTLGHGDGEGLEMIEDLETKSIQVGCTLRHGYDVAVAYIIEDEKKKTRSIVSWNKVPDITSEELWIALAELLERNQLRSSPSWIHIEGRNGIEVKAFLDTLANSSMSSSLPIVSLDVEDSTRPGIVSLIPMADVLIISGGDVSMKKVTGGLNELEELRADPVEITRMISDLCLKHSSVLYITLGSAGCLMLYSEACRFPKPVFDNHSTKVWHQDGIAGPLFRILGNLQTQQKNTDTAWTMVEIGPLPNCNPIVETVGAGDTFNAGVIFGLSQGLDVLAAGKLGNTVAGRKCMQTGFEGLWRTQDWVRLHKPFGTTSQAGHRITVVLL